MVESVDSGSKVCLIHARAAVAEGAAVQARVVVVPPPPPNDRFFDRIWRWMLHEEVRTLVDSIKDGLSMLNLRGIPGRGDGRFGEFASRGGTSGRT